ncbi:MAG: hypothetical protein ACREBC_30885, partial [Pyrinomonadaceae bacterium]
ATTSTFQQNQSAFRRLIGVMLGISILISVSATVLQLTLVRSDQGFRIFNVVAYGMFFLFPVVPSFGAVLRAPRWKVLCVSLFFSAIFVEPHWFSRFDLVRIGWNILPFLTQTLVPLLLVAMTLVNGGSRAIAPIIFLPYFALFLTFAGVLSLPSFLLGIMPDFSLRAPFPGCRTTSTPAGNVVNAGADDVSVDRSADGARRHLSENRSRMGQRGLPDGGWREYGPASMRML